MTSMMRRLSASLIVLAFTSSAMADDADVLLSDSFESGATAPDGWKQGNAVPGVKYIYDRRGGSEGQRSLCLQKSIDRYYPIAAWTRTVEDSGEKPAIRLAARVKAEKAMKAILDVAFVDEQGEWISHEWIAYIGAEEPGDPPATHDWKEYTGAADIPAGTAKIVVGLQIYGPGKVWFDEVEARYADSVEEANKKETSSTAVARPEAIPVSLGDSVQGQYLLVPPGDDAAAPNEGYPVLVVLPGGDGSADFHPFVRRIHQRALDGRFIVAQPLAPPHIVWPTSNSLASLTYPTEDFIEAVIGDVAEMHTVDRDRIYLLAWSSGGPAAYAALLQENSVISGALIAMSVFKPDQLPSPANARGKGVYLLHSPDDRVCPHWMAKQANEQLQAAAVRVTLVDYDGGHGWHGPVFDQIRAGIDWLETR